MGIVRRFYELICAMLGRESPAMTFPATPQGLTEQQFHWLSDQVRGKASRFGTDMFVQGSRAAGTANPESDLDIAILVDASRFEEILRSSFGFPKAGSAKERTMHHAASTGKIQAGEAGLRPLRRLLEMELGMDVDISVIRRGGPFDRPPYVPLRMAVSEELS